MLTLSNDERGYLSEAEQERLGIISIPELKELRTIPFVDKDTVVEGVRQNISPYASDKYTVVIWLEGEDPECVDSIKGGEIEYKMIFETIDDEE